MRGLHYQIPRPYFSPIRTKQDNARGGWILGVGLTSDPRPTNRHNLDFTKKPEDSKIWRWTIIRDAVLRVGDRFRDLLEAFPQDRAVALALELFQYMISDDAHLTIFHTHCSESQVFEATCDNYSLNFVAELSAQQWETALLAFNRRGPLTPEQNALFPDHTKCIVWAALRGLRYVLIYGHFASHFHVIPISKIPPMPELTSKRFVFLTSCTEKDQ